MEETAVRSKASSRTKWCSTCSLDLDGFVQDAYLSVGRTEYKAEGLGVIGFLEVTVVSLFHSISADSNTME